MPSTRRRDARKRRPPPYSSPFQRRDDITVLIAPRPIPLDTPCPLSRTYTRPPTRASAGTTAEPVGEEQPSSGVTLSSLLHWVSDYFMSFFLVDDPQPIDSSSSEPPIIDNSSPPPPPKKQKLEKKTNNIQTLSANTALPLPASYCPGLRQLQPLTVHSPGLNDESPSRRKFQDDLERRQRELDVINEMRILRAGFKNAQQGRQKSPPRLSSGGPSEAHEPQPNQFSSSSSSKPPTKTDNNTEELTINIGGIPTLPTSTTVPRHLKSPEGVRGHRLYKMRK